MSEEACQFLHEQIESSINRCRQEWDITYGEIIGVLEIQKTVMAKEAVDDKD